MMQVCTVSLDCLIKNYAIRGIDKSVELKSDAASQLKWIETYTRNLKNLLSAEENVITETLRREFASGYSKDFLNREDYDEIKKNHSEGTDYCVRVICENVTLCLLSKREIQ